MARPKTYPPGTKKMTLQLPPMLHEALDDRAAETGQDKTRIVHKALCTELDVDPREGIPGANE